METYQTADTFVSHMEKDLKSDLLLFSDGSSLKVTDGEGVTTLVGSASDIGYREGVGLEARFYYIGGFVQINESTIVVSDYWNDCLRQIDRDTLATSTFAGVCKTAGHKDGLVSLFDGPWSILLDSNSTGLFVVDRTNNAIRYVNLATINVTTLPNLRFLLGPAGMSYDSTGDNLLITNNYNIIRYSLQTHSVTVIAGTRSKNGDLSSIPFQSPRDILILTKNIFLVADDKNHVIRVLDMELSTFASLCNGSAGTVNGNVDRCELHRPYSLLLLDGFLYVGQNQAIRRMPGA